MMTTGSVSHHSAAATRPAGIPAVLSRTSRMAAAIRRCMGPLLRTPERSVGSICNAERVPRVIPHESDVTPDERHRYACGDSGSHVARRERSLARVGALVEVPGTVRPGRTERDGPIYHENVTSHAEPGRCGNCRNRQ